MTKTWPRGSFLAASFMHGRGERRNRIVSCAVERFVKSGAPGVARARLRASDRASTRTNRCLGARSTTREGALENTLGHASSRAVALRSVETDDGAMAPRPCALILALMTSACTSVGPETRSYIVRLKPGQELKTELAQLARDHGLRAASIVSAVGSLTDVSLRLANQPEATRYAGHFEVVALSGYLAAEEFHVHMAVSDGEGRTIGGHVMEGNRVYTTLVVVIEEHLRFDYRREHDPASGYDELVVDERHP